MARDLPEIKDYSFGHIQVGNQTYTNDLIILPDRLVTNWWRDEGHVLKAGDLDAVLEMDDAPEILIVGQGAYGRMRVARAAHDALAAAGIELIAKSTEQACEEYNALRGHRRIAAALHLTC
jgi:hypothetical protein